MRRAHDRQALSGPWRTTRLPRCSRGRSSLHLSTILQLELELELGRGREHGSPLAMGAPTLCRPSPRRAGMRGPAATFSASPQRLAQRDERREKNDGFPVRAWTRHGRGGRFYPLSVAPAFFECPCRVEMPSGQKSPTGDSRLSHFRELLSPETLDVDVVLADQFPKGSAVLSRPFRGARYIAAVGREKTLDIRPFKACHCAGLGLLE